MALSYRRIEEDTDYASLIWEREESAPRWFRDAAHVWIKDYPAFLEFWKNCREIYGLFDDRKLVAVVYLEFDSDTSINIHVSVLEQVSSFQIVRFFSSLRRLKQSEGVKDMRGWILDRNRHLLDIARRAGFHETQFRRDYGQSRGRLLRWVEVRG